jgi:hypothetical protein
MTADLFTLTADSPDPSLAAPIPRGWTSERFKCISNQEFKRAVDPDGCRWYWTDGKWKLEVPYFRRSRNLAPDAPDDIAVVDHIHGHKLCHITPAGVIHIGSRRIPATRWQH